jgi:predicted negative regulator of RcsB-dependent stress response
MYDTDQEQLDQLKAWWQRYGRWVMIAVAVTGFAYLGWHFWQETQQSRQEQAATHFASLIKAIDTHQTADIEAQLKLMRDKYAKTAYADIGSLLVARLSVEAKDYDEAKVHLRWVASHSHYPTYRDLAQLRLARILMEEEQWVEASALLSTLKAPEYQTLVAELQGDLRMKENKPEEARKAYQKAYELAPPALQDRALLQMKQQALPSPTPP